MSGNIVDYVDHILIITWIASIVLIETNRFIIRRGMGNMWNDNTRYWLTPQELEDYIIATEIYGDEVYDSDGKLIEGREYWIEDLDEDDLIEYCVCHSCGCFVHEVLGCCCNDFEEERDFYGDEDCED
jgi:hypothetical protein